jgi:hypothetical protein
VIPVVLRLSEAFLTLFFYGVEFISKELFR